MKKNIINIMNVIKKIILYTLICSCAVFMIVLIFSFLTRDDFSEELVTDNYYITKPDHMEEDRSLNYKIEGNGYLEIVQAYISQIASDDEFIIVLQHPKEFAEPINYSLTNYYIIPLNNRISSVPKKRRLGPLSEKEFLDMKKKMNITLEFKPTN